MNNLIGVFTIVLVLGMLAYYALFTTNKQKEDVVSHSISTSTDGVDAKNKSEPLKNFSYTYNGRTVTLLAGRSYDGTTDISYFGNEAKGDLNNDNEEDVAFLLQETTKDGSTLYYAIVAIKKEDSYTMTNPFYIGKNISPQSTVIVSGELHVNFGELIKTESSSSSVFMGATTLLKVTNDLVLEGLMK